MLPIMNIGGLALQTPGLVLLAGLWIGLTLSERNAHRHGITADQLYNLVFVTLITGIIGARLSYAVQFPSAFAASPRSLLSINPGLLDPFGGAAAGFIAAVIFGQRKGLRFWPTLDALVPLIGVMLIASAASNLASGAGFGAATSLPWAIELWGESRHPTQVYEIIAGIAILLVFWPGRRDESSPPGTAFLIFVGASAFARLFLEGFHGDSLTLPNGVRLLQVAAWLIGGATLFGWVKRNQSEDKIEIMPFEPPSENKRKQFQRKKKNRRS